jgi:hypothetical protein
MLDPSQRYGYQLYGLRISANLPRPEAQHLATDDWPASDIGITFHEGQTPPAIFAQLPWRTLYRVVGDELTYRIALATHRDRLHHALQIDDSEGMLHAYITPSDQRGHNLAHSYQMDVYWHNRVQPPDQVFGAVLTWTFDVALGHAVRLSVPANLHGSALAMDGRAIAFLGQKGAGKSTLSAALVKAGWPMLADDHVALWPRPGQSSGQGVTQVWVEPGAPRLRLWPTSLPIVDLQAEELPRLYSFQEKRLVAQVSEAGQAAEFQAVALPLGAVYLLEARDPTCTQVSVTRLNPKEALFALLQKRFSAVNVSPEHAAAELSVLSQIAQEIPVLRLHRPDGLESLPHVIECIRRDLTSYDLTNRDLNTPIAAPTQR